MKLKMKLEILPCQVCMLGSAIYNDINHNFEYLERALTEWNRRYTLPGKEFLEKTMNVPNELPEEKVLDNEPRTV